MTRKSEEETLEELEALVERGDAKLINGWRAELSAIKTPACKNAENVPATIQVAVETIVNNRSANKYLFSILLTCCVKKLVNPEQDTRIAQDNMKGGYSNRSLDQRIVTPFLKRHGYTHCEASGLESGRNLERPIPWNLEYPTNPRGEGNREAFLGILSHLEDHKGSPRTVALYLMHCDRSKQQLFSRTVVAPQESEISAIMRVFERHFKESSGQGRSRLPVLAIYAIYERLVVELARYKGTTLLPLERHTTADMRSLSIGDIQVNRGVMPFEGVEVKSEKPITASMVNELLRKFAGRKVSRYYLLSTSTPYVLEKDQESISEAVHDVGEQTGTQIIVNGLIRTLWYYMRLLSDPATVLPAYQKLIDEDPDVRPEIRDVWNKIVTEEYPNEGYARKM